MIFLNRNSQHIFIIIFSICLSGYYNLAHAQDSIALKKLTVLVLDAGHGGIDPGTTGIRGLKEKSVTLQLAKKVRSKLSSIDNLFIALTRYDDRTMNIESRNKIISSVQADFVISLHLNSLPQKNLALVEAYYDDVDTTLSKHNALYSESKNAYQDISKKLADTIQRSVYSTVKKYNKEPLDGGTKTNSMRILSKNKALGSLLEITCLSNPTEEARLRTPAYIDELATSIADGVKQFLKQYSSKQQPKALTAEKNKPIQQKTSNKS